MREAIEYSGLEQKELANKTNMSLRNIENYLRKDASMPSADKAVRLAQALGVTVEYLVNGNALSDESKLSFFPPELRTMIKLGGSLSKKNLKLALVILKTLKEQE